MARDAIDARGWIPYTGFSVAADARRPFLHSFFPDYDKAKDG
jgi:hypothetical protein